MNENCEVKKQNVNNVWVDIKEAALDTVGKKQITAPTAEWKTSLLISEHSPIRLLKINWLWKTIKSFVSVHFVRHKIGIDHFVRTQREDSTKKDTSNNTRSTLIQHRCDANAQAIINISRKRLCKKAHKETRIKWIEFLESIKKNYPELYFVCVPECIYRYGCPEMKSCCFFNDIEFIICDNIDLDAIDFFDIKKRYAFFHEHKKDAKLFCEAD